MTAAQARRNPSWTWQASDHTIIRIDYVWATQLYHLWCQPPGDTQAYWVGQTPNPVGAEALLQGLLGNWSAASGAALRSALDAMR